ncbi:MAG: polysaccharide pyruvyl transferase family protein [Anaerolineae bacterium]|jgi:hypothetical protein
MNIGAIGWWSYHNQGDLAMLAALRQGLAPHTVVPIDTGFAATPDAVYRLNRLDYLLLGGGTLIADRPAPPFDTFEEWMDDLACPLGVVGLGVDPVHPAHWPTVEAMLDRASFWYVRDQQSRHNLHDHPKVQVAPDLSFLRPLSVRPFAGEPLGPRPLCAVNLRRGAAADLDPDPWVAAIRRLPLRLVAIPLSTYAAFDERLILQQLDPDVAPQFDAALYQQADLVIGTAYHAVLFAVQAGSPVIAIGYAPKVDQFMQENGLGRWLIRPDEPAKLASRVEELLSEHASVAAKLVQIRDRLHQEARAAIEDVHQAISAGGPRISRSGPRATIAVIGSGDPLADRRTLASCIRQTYGNVQVLLVDANPPENIAIRLQRTLARSSGEYLGWIGTSERLATDAIDCLASRLTEDPDLDVVYADYQAVDAEGLPVGQHVVPDANKLYRRDVVGPCFLMRRRLLRTLARVSRETPLMAYGLWLAAHPTHKLAPFHAPLCRSSRPVTSPAYVAQERATRRIWRQTQPALWQAAWQVIDSRLGERLLMQPLAWLCRTLGRSSHA